MPYFFILPAFVLYLLAMGAILVATRLYRPAAHLSPVVVSMLIWSCAGFILSTVAYAVVLVLSAVAMRRLLHGQPSTAGGVIMGGVVFIGPFVAAGVGVLGGAGFGVWRKRRQVRWAGEQSTAPDSGPCG